MKITAVADTGYTLGDAEAEWTLKVDAVDCAVETKPTTPTYTVQQCLPTYTVQSAAVTIPSTTGVVYYLDGTLTPAGTIDVATGTHTVTALPTVGYELTDYPTDGWTATITAVPCEVAVLAQPPVKAAPVLANTGSNSTSMLVLGLLVLGAGAGMVALTARRRSDAA